MSDQSPSDESKSSHEQSDASNDSTQRSAEVSAARAARRLKRVAPTSGESRLARISRARRANQGPVKHPRDLLGVSLADGRYVVKAPLGKGSMAYVFRASDARLQTDVVLKVPKPEKVNTADFRERFHRESQMLIRFSHPHVVKVLDVGEYSELPYVVMQLLEGGSLSDRIAREADENGCMSPESLKTWVREVARALDFCYRKGMVHRDVKPANILFDEDNNAYVGDFGLSKIMCGEHSELSSDETAAGVVLGTPNYISPEVVQGKDYDGRSDQYSLGITIYHVLTGGPPMQGNTATMTMLNQTQKVLPLLSDVRSEIPRPLAVAVRKAIEKDPAKRFNTCEEFAEAVIEGLRFAPMISTSSNSSASPAVAKSLKPVAPASPSSASSTPKSKATAGRKNKASSSAGSSLRKERKAVDASGTSSKSSIRKKTRRRKVASGSSSRSSQRRSTSASSSLTLNADMDWFDMDISGEYSSGRSSSSSRSSSRSSRRQRTKKAKPANQKLVHVFGQQLHPMVLVGLAVFSLFSVVMVVWSPWAPDEISPELVAGQYHPTEPNARSNSQKKNANSKSGGKRSAANRQASTTTSGPSAGKNDKLNATAALPRHGDSGKVNEAAANTELEGSHTGEQKVSSTIEVEIHEDPEPLFDVPAGSTLFGGPSADVFVSGRVVRSRKTAGQERLLSGRYSDEGLSVLSDDGKWFAATVTDRLDRDFVVRVWNTETGAIQFEIKGDGRRRVRNLFLSGRFLYLETDRATQLQVWNLQKRIQEGLVAMPSGRLRSQRMGMTKDGAAFATIVSDEYAIIDGRSGAVTSSLAAPSPPKIQVAMVKSSIGLSRTGSNELIQSTRILDFSDDQLQLAAVRTLPQPTLTIWNEAGLLQDDLPFGVGAKSCQSDAVHWLTNRRAWLVNGSIVDGKNRRVVVCVPHDDEQIATIGLQDDDHLLTTVRSDAGSIYRRQIPWEHIDASLQSMPGDESALLKPGASVQLSVDVTDQDNTGMILRPMLERALEQKLRTEKISIGEDAKLTFRLLSRKVAHRDDLVTLLELVESEDERVLWYAVVGPSLQIKADDFAAQKTIAEEISRKISTLAIPYYVPSDSARIMLPYCIEN